MKPNQVTTGTYTDEMDERADALMIKHGLNPLPDGPDDVLMQGIHEGLTEKFGLDPIHIHNMAKALRCYAETLDVFPTPVTTDLN